MLLDRDSRAAVAEAERNVMVVEPQLEEEEADKEEVDVETVKTVKMEVRAVEAVAVAEEATEVIEAAVVEEEASMADQEEAVVAVVAVKETRVLKMVKEPLLILLRLVDSETDIRVKLVRKPIHTTANQEPDVEREMLPREVPEKVTGVTIRLKLMLVQKKKRQKPRHQLRKRRSLRKKNLRKKDSIWTLT